jgi:hypothetical protein
VQGSFRASGASYLQQEAVVSILSDVKEIEAKVRESMENGPVTPYYTLPLDKVYDLLNAALASEIICIPTQNAASA